MSIVWIILFFKDGFYFQRTLSILVTSFRMKILISFILLLPLFVKGQEYNWLNPIPNGNSCGSIAFVSDQIGYIQTDKDLWRTSNQGLTWESWAKIAGNALDFNGSTGFIVGRSGLIFKSVNSGLDWVEIPTSISDNLIEVQVVNSNTVYTVSDRLIYKSNNGGNTWIGSEISFFENGLTEIASITKLHFINETVGHIFTKNGYVFRTTDGGSSWQVVFRTFHTPSNIVSVNFFDDKIGYVARYAHSILWTQDGGVTWSETTVSPTVDAVFFLDQNLGFAADDGRLYKTEDGGQSWSADYSFKAPISRMHFLKRDLGFAISTIGKVYKTTDAGISWQSNSLFEDKIGKIYFVDEHIGFVLSDYVFKSHDGGRNWNKIVTGFEDPELKFQSLAFINSNKIFATLSNTFRDRMIVSEDGGNSWTLSLIAASEVEFINQQIGFCAGLTGFYSTTDGGDHWVLTSTFSAAKFKALSLDVVLAVRNKAIYRSVNSGKAWTKLLGGTGTDDDIENIQFVNDSVGFAVGTGFFATKDFGRTWNKISWPSVSFINDLHFLNSNMGVIIGRSNDIPSYLGITSDGGNSWERYPKPHLMSSVFLKPSGQAIVGGINSFLVESDVTFNDISFKVEKPVIFANSFAQFKLIIATSIHDLSDLRFEFSRGLDFEDSFPLDPAYLKAGSNSVQRPLFRLLPNSIYNFRIVGKADGKEVASRVYTFSSIDGSEVVTGIDKEGEPHLIVYPNPSHSIVQLTSDVKINRLIIFSSTLSQVDEFELNSKEFTLDISKYSSGLYFILLQAGDQRYTRIIQKR